MNQLIVIADMEGASGIFDYSREQSSAIWPEDIYPEGRMWREYGRYCITSDVLAVCNAANDCGINEIMLYDIHYAGCKKYNVMLEKLPSNVRVFDMPYIANIGCAASHEEALGLSNNVSCITVKDKAKQFEPTYEEAYIIIYDGVRSALKEYDKKECCTFTGYCEFEVNLCERFYFEAPDRISWKGSFDERTAFFEAPSVEIGFEILDIVRDMIRKNE